ncbi:chemotaxis protein CheW [Tundrisphaera sp. TA3]|uniref:chemotaxis protein CheW n=1 Tax=Tundrisphaera sp. TA3 TaxID=3435775 RepID=UPI003EB75E54
MSSTRSPSPTSPDRELRREDQSIRQLVGFRLDDADYAIAITKIREIILMKPITRLPQVPASIEGLINLRGTVIPIVNLRKRFGMAHRPFDDETRTVVVTVHDRTIGCIVDEVTQVIRVAADQVQPVPVAMTALAKRYIAGLARLEDRLVIIIDIEKLFGPDEIDLEPAPGPHPIATSSPTSPTESGA